MVTEFIINERGIAVTKQVTWQEIAHDDTLHNEALNFQYFEGFQRKKVCKSMF